jgi:hypothetical protein
VVGKFYCLDKGDWDRGLPRLALGGDANLKDLAKSDLECTSGADAMAALANRYAAHSEKEESTAKTHLLWRACYWYERAEGMSKDDAARAKVLAAKRAAVEKNLPPTRPRVLFCRFGSTSNWATPTVNLKRLLFLSGGHKLVFPNGIHSDLEIALQTSREPNTLVIVYRYRGRVRLSTTKESEAVLIPPQGGFDTQPGRPEPGQELTILYAKHGTGGTFADITPKLQSAVNGKMLNAKVADLGLADAAPGNPKLLVIVYSYAGRVYFYSGGDEHPIILDPPVTEP